MDATSTTRAGTEPVDLSGVPETMLPLCARAQHTLSPRPRFQDHDAAAARTGRPTVEGTVARALTQHLPVLRARCAPLLRTGGRVCWGSPAHYMAAASHFRTGGRAEPVAELVTCTNPRPRTGGRDQGPVTGQTGERP